MRLVSCCGAGTTVRAFGPIAGPSRKGGGMAVEGLAVLVLGGLSLGMPWRARFIVASFYRYESQMALDALSRHFIPRCPANVPKSIGAGMPKLSATPLC